MCIVKCSQLYEESMLENERLQEKLRRTEEDLNEARNVADKSVTVCFVIIIIFHSLPILSGLVMFASIQIVLGEG